MNNDYLIAKIAHFADACRRDKQTPLFVLLGQTASGKTALSLSLAHALNGEIISADSRQVYKHMDIGTDKIPAEKRDGIPHHLLDVAVPSERFTVFDFMLHAAKVIDEITSRGKLPMLVGGTGLYINALTENFQIPRASEAMIPQDHVACIGDATSIRKKLETSLREHGKEWLHKKLAEVDPENASKIHPNSHLYVLRALEIFYATGHPKRDRKGPPKYKTLKIGLRWEQEKLSERIWQRVEEQYKRGLVDEVRSLLAMGYTKELPALRTLGYREVIANLEGALSLEQAKNLIIKNTRAFARRQMTWFKRDKTIEWISGQLN